MPNGKPGDNPLTDLLVHGDEVWGKEIDQMLIEIYEQDRQLINSIPNEVIYSNDKELIIKYLVQIKEGLNK